VSLLDKAADKAHAVVDDEADDWLAKGVDAARKHLGKLDHFERDAAARALDLVEKYQAPLADVGRARLLAAIQWTGLGEKDKARRAWLAGGATFAERRAASSASTARTLEEAQRREVAWAEFQKFAAEAGMVALRVALPLLLAAL
jgi:hypothetical protein